ncbi:MAG: trigger factor [Candidatus Levyibacteriota bacterium]
MQIEKSIAEDKTITLKVTIPWKEVESEREKVVDSLVKQVTVPGFRKGTAPRNIAEKHLKKEVVQEEMLKNLLGKAYNEAVKKENLTPIITPRIHVETFEDGTDLVFNAELCEAPDVALGNYKDPVKKITAKGKIVVPGKETAKPNVDEILDALVANASVVIPKVLYENEANRLLSQMLDELKSLGLSLDQYLASRGKTADDMRGEYEEKAKKDLALEFILRKVADSENITVEKEDLENVLKDVQDEAQKQQLSANPYLLASIIRQQKTLDFLTNL